MALDGVQFDVGINNIPFCYKGTNEADFSVDFPSVIATVEKKALIHDDTNYFISASETNTTNISKTIIAPYIFCNGIFVEKGKSVIVCSKSTNTDISSLGKYSSEYSISFNTNNTITLKTTASYGKISTSSESGSVKLTANKWTAVVKPCQGPIDKINFKGNPVDLLKYGTSNVWLRKINANIIPTSDTTINISRASNSYLDTLRIGSSDPLYYGDKIDGSAYCSNSLKRITGFLIDGVNQITVPTLNATFSGKAIKDNSKITVHEKWLFGAWVTRYSGNYSNTYNITYDRSGGSTALVKTFSINLAKCSNLSTYPIKITMSYTLSVGGLSPNEDSVSGTLTEYQLSSSATTIDLVTSKRRYSTI